jgi:8-oxo-dGTP diphosphatase
MDIPVGLKRTVVLCILRSKEGLLLLCRSEEPLVGKYVPVGGHLEPFETPKAAAIREVREETGVTIDDATLRGILTETSPTKYNWMIYVYSADIEPMTPPDCSEGKLEWISHDRLSEIPTPLTDHFMYDYVSNSQFFVLDAVYNEKIELLTLTNELTGQVLYNNKDTKV